MLQTGHSYGVLAWPMLQRSILFVVHNVKNKKRVACGRNLKCEIFSDTIRVLFLCVMNFKKAYLLIDSSMEIAESEARLHEEGK
jgi:hypothetical protein